MPEQVLPTAQQMQAQISEITVINRFFRLQLFLKATCELSNLKLQASTVQLGVANGDILS
jgi:hypothetical protein